MAVTALTKTVIKNKNMQKARKGILDLIKRPVEISSFLGFLGYFLNVPIIAVAKHLSSDRQKSPFFYFTKILTEDLGVKFKKDSESKPLAKGKVIYLFNHRSWADFFIHSYLCGGETSYLSRQEVAMAMPTLNFANLFSTRLWLFDRSKRISPEVFYEWLDDKFVQSKKFNGGDLIVYPEGTRNLTNKPLPVKKGLLRYAYSRKIPVQVAICKGCEDVFSGKLMRVQSGVTLDYSFTDTINPENFTDESSFINHVSSVFKSEFNRIYQ